MSLLIKYHMHILESLGISGSNVNEFVLYADEEHDEHHEELRNSSAAALPEETDSRQHLNVVFIGHVGKKHTFNLHGVSCVGFLENCLSGCVTTHALMSISPVDQRKLHMVLKFLTFWGNEACCSIFV